MTFFSKNLIDKFLTFQCQFVRRVSWKPGTLWWHWRQTILLGFPTDVRKDSRAHGSQFFHLVVEAGAQIGL